MDRTFLPLVPLVLLLCAAPSPGADPFPSDTIPSAEGDITITFIGHATLMLGWQGKVIHVDPWSKLADYGPLPKADLILVTHGHQDHLDLGAILKASKAGTLVAADPASAAKVPDAVALANGDKRNLAGIFVKAVPAYNLVHRRPDGTPYHPRGEGNGYLIGLGGKTVYVAGDTEDIPEMEGMGNIDVAFLPANLPYTMTPEMLRSAAGKVKPRVLYPYHLGDTDTARVTALFADLPGTELRLRPILK